VPLWWVVDESCACHLGEGCNHPGKHPHSRHGTRRPLESGLDVDLYWRRHPKCNIGIATGEISNLVVLDIDPRSGGYVSYQRLTKAHGDFPSTPVSITGGNGRHVLFAHPGVRIKNHVGFVAGMDIRADGGLIVAPPSMHSSGRSYRWHTLGHPNDYPVAQLPMWLFRMIYSMNIMQQLQRQSLMPRTKGSNKIDIENIPAITEGGRNDKLCSIAGRLCWEKRSPKEVADAIEYINRAKCSPPLSDKEVYKIVRSACSKWAL